MNWNPFSRNSPEPLTLKQSATSGVTLLNLASPSPIVPDKSYYLLSKSGYERVLTVYACVNEVANTVAASANWYLVDRGVSRKAPPKRIVSPDFATKAARYSAGSASNVSVVEKRLRASEVENHPLLDLLEHPNSALGKSDYFRQTVSFFLISGNSYEELTSKITAKPGTGPVLELWNIRPDHMFPIPADPTSARGLVAGYRFGESELDPAGHTFSFDEVIHRRMFHPTHDFLGLSPLQVAMRTIQSDNAAVDWNLALTRNMMRPPGALIAPEPVSDSTYERIKEEVVQSFSGSQNAGTPIFLEGGLQWKQFGMSQSEVDWLDGRAYTRTELCALYNVAPELIGDSVHKTYNSYPEARKALYLEAALPLLDAIRDAYNQFLVPRFGDRLVLEYDRDLIEAIQEDRERLWRRTRVANWLTTNEKRDLTGYVPDDHPSADTPTAFLGDDNSSDADAILDTEDGRQGQDGSAPDDPLKPDDEDMKSFTPRQFDAGQRAARRALRKITRRHLSAQGEALASHFEREINKL